VPHAPWLHSAPHLKVPVPREGCLSTECSFCIASIPTSADSRYLGLHTPGHLRSSTPEFLTSQNLLRIEIAFSIRLLHTEEISLSLWPRRPGWA
jgi:hypothetical protein